MNSKRESPTPRNPNQGSDETVDTPIRIKTASEQLADHLRAKILCGKLTDRMPGATRLTKELGVGRMTVEGALGILEAEGLVSKEGGGRPRKIRPVPKRRKGMPRIGLLFYANPTDLKREPMGEIVHALELEDYSVTPAKNSLLGLNMDVQRVATMVEEAAMDAWIVLSGPRKVLEWFAGRPEPCCALFGRFEDLPIAGAGFDMLPAQSQCVSRLIELGHRRIVKAGRKDQREPDLGPMEQAFVDQMEAAGIATSSYHLPSWDAARPEPVRQCYEKLFHCTPPTAMIVGHGPPLMVAQQFLAERRLAIPEDVSLVCCDGDFSFRVNPPVISYFQLPMEHFPHRLLRWAHHVENGQTDVAQTRYKTRFIEAPSIGPVNDLL